MSTHDLQKSNPHQLGSLLDVKHLADTLFTKRLKDFSNSEDAVARDQKALSISMDNLKILTDAGVTIVTGTDAGNIGTLHASSYLAELKAMQESGMSNWQIIKASTINGAKILDKEDEFGTVSIGKQANLILLDANPVDDIENLSKINVVINKGTSFTPGTMRKNTPEDLAQQQLNAYNFKNIDAFLEPYAEDVEVYTYPDELRYKGKEEMRKIYTELFNYKIDIHCEVSSRIVQGNIVIDKEKIQFGDRRAEATAIYLSLIHI